MNTFPEFRTRRQAFKDWFFSVRGMTHMMMGTAFAIWIFAKFFPNELGLFYLTVPLPSPFSDSGLYLPGHLWLGVIWYQDHRKGMRYKAPLLRTATENFSVDPLYGHSFRGAYHYLELGVLPRKRPARRIRADEGIAIVDAMHVDISKGGHYDAPSIELVRVDMVELPPGVYKDFVEMRAPAEARFLMGFTEGELSQDDKGRSSAIVMRNMNRLHNTKQYQFETELQVMRQAADATASVAKRADDLARGRGRAPIQLPPSNQQQANQPVIIEQQ